MLFSSLCLSAFLFSFVVSFFLAFFPLHPSFFLASFLVCLLQSSHAPPFRPLLDVCLLTVCFFVLVPPLPFHWTETYPAHPPFCESTPRGQLECKYPFTRIAVIMPMTFLDVGIMVNAMRLWSHPDYKPCDPKKDYRKHIDLIFQNTVGSLAFSLVSLFFPCRG